MYSYGVNKAPDDIYKFLQAPEVSTETKDLCFRLLLNPYVREVLKQTPISALFGICQEYKKHPDLYDEIFYGRIKFFAKGLMEDALPIFNYKEISHKSTLKNFIGPKTLPGQVVEKFADCGVTKNEIKRIRVKLKGSKLLTAAFNANHTIISMTVDPIEKDTTNDLIQLLNTLAEGMVDLIRV